MTSLDFKNFSINHAAKVYVNILLHVGEYFLLSTYKSIFSYKDQSSTVISLRKTGLSRTVSCQLCYDDYWTHPESF